MKTNFTICFQSRYFVVFHWNMMFNSILINQNHKYVYIWCGIENAYIRVLPFCIMINLARLFVQKNPHRNKFCLQSLTFSFDYFEMKSKLYNFSLTENINLSIFWPNVLQRHRYLCKSLIQ